MNEILLIDSNLTTNMFNKVCLVCDLITKFSESICPNCNSPLIEKPKPDK